MACLIEEALVDLEEFDVGVDGVDEAGGAEGGEVGLAAVGAPPELELLQQGRHDDALDDEREVEADA